jgi:hypothetical protein
MNEGFRALSTGYVEDFVASSRDAGITIESVAAEGRSYVGILPGQAYQVDLTRPARARPSATGCWAATSRSWLTHLATFRHVADG